MTPSLDNGLGTHDVEQSLRQAAERVSLEFCSSTQGGDVPAAYIAFVEEVAFDAMSEALHGASVEDFREWVADNELDERVERSLP